MSVSLIPESAPFTAEQRAWLNGFLAGWIGLGGEEGLAGAGAIANTVGLPAPPAAASEPEEQFPWHDPNLSLDERLALAEGKPRERRLMAAMAQLDCGACGYLCKTYSEAIAAGTEKNLTLCSPGGKETAKAVKLLLKEAPAANGAAMNGTLANGAAPASAAKGHTRANPYSARVLSCAKLNGAGSAKVTTHVAIDLGESGLSYRVGDALGVYPSNCPELVSELLTAIGLSEEAALGARLTDEHSLRDVSDELLELLASKATVAAEAKRVRGLIGADELDTMDVLDAVRLAPSARLSAEEFLATLSPMNPRLYSIASSLVAHPGEVHLTIGRATTRVGAREHKGVASTMFSDRVAEGDRVRVFVHASHGFSVPSDPAAPMIMVGPGTGIAPFRAFLEERQVTGAPGKNWLFFGDQHEATDFLYRDELEGMQASGVLTRLSAAFSRDQEEKVYVQDRLRESGAEVWAWLEEGAYFFVCGDAKRMAADVDRALHDVVATHGGLGADGAKAYVERLRKEGRYARDVY